MSPRSLLLCALACTLLLSSCVVGRFVVWNFADIRDYKKFPSREVAKGGRPFQFHTPLKERAPSSLTVKGRDVAFEDYLRRNKTVAFLIIQHDTIKYEHYFAGYDDASVVPSFSMAKSVTSMLVGCAIADGYIKNVEQPVTDFVPELKAHKGMEAVTVRHLLQMTSGIRFQESYYNPFAGAALYYYGRNLRRKVTRMKLKATPGQRFEYISGGTQLLGTVLDRALKGKTISAYLQEKLWQPLGMEWDASWSTDQKAGGIEKTFCCLNARARDFARLGRLYLHNGNWNGTQIIPATWVKESTTPDTTGGGARYYKYQWWLPTNGRWGDYMMQGFLGQYVYVNPAKDMVIVRLGKNEGKAPWWEILTSLAAGY